jgi:hypothetical protein
MGYYRMHAIRRGLTGVATAAVLLGAGLTLTGSSAVASAAVQGRSHAVVHASQVSVQGHLSKPRPSGTSENPDGTPTGCPAPGNLCTYINEGSGQGAGNICLEATGGVSDFGDRTAPDGDNCHSHDGALVNTHTSGENTLWSGTNASGHETCIAHGSYYSDLANNHYPGVSGSLHNNIDSSYYDSGTTCIA